jgi:hypothetical protein
MIRNIPSISTIIIVVVILATLDEPHDDGHQPILSSTNGQAPYDAIKQSQRKAKPKPSTIKGSLLAARRG